MTVRDPNTGVPILSLGKESQTFIEEAHSEAHAARDEGNHELLLTGEVAIVHNPRPIGAPDTPDDTYHHIGGSTLQEAVTEVVGGHEYHTLLEQPDYVASTNEDLARLLAEHYNCEVRALADVDSAKAAPTEEPAPASTQEVQA